MSEKIKLAHLSDFHLAGPIKWGEFNPKRALGYLNWRFRRRFHFKRELLTQAVKKLLAAKVDAVLFSGDWSQHGLLAELELAEKLLQPLTQAGIPILGVQGNHDYYGWNKKTASFFTQMKQRLQLDVPVDTANIARLGGHEILLMEQACPTPPFCSYGKVRKKALQKMHDTLKTDTNGMRIAVGHYPLYRAT